MLLIRQLIIVRLSSTTSTPFSEACVSCGYWDCLLFELFEPTLEKCKKFREILVVLFDGDLFKGTHYEYYFGTPPDGYPFPGDCPVDDHARRVFKLLHQLYNTNATLIDYLTRP